jgi:hypothetical protein
MGLIVFSAPKKPTKPSKPSALSGKKPAKFALEGKNWTIVRTSIIDARLYLSHYDRNIRKMSPASLWMTVS